MAVNNYASPKECRMRRSIGLRSFTVFFFDLQLGSITVCRSVSLREIYQKRSPRNLRGELHNEDARAILAQMEGVFSAYGKVTFESPHPNVTAPPASLIALFDRLLNDPDYLQLSDAVSDLALPQKRRAALSRVRDCGRRACHERSRSEGMELRRKCCESVDGCARAGGRYASVISLWAEFPCLSRSPSSLY